MLRKGIAAHEENKLKDAEHLYRNILQAEPLHAVANYNLGLIAMSVNKVDTALPLFRIAVKANSKVERFWHSYIDALIKAEKCDNARQALVDAQLAGITGAKIRVFREQLSPALYPSSDEARQELCNQSQGHQDDLSPAIELREVGKYREAQEWLTNVIKHDSENPEALSLLSQVLLLDDKEREAEMKLKAAVSINSELPSIYRNQARLLLKNSKTVEALERAEIGCKQSPEDIESLLVLAACLGANQRDLEALQLIDQILDAKSNYAEAYATRALIRLRAKNISDAIEDTKMAVSLKPHLTQMWHLLSSLHHQTNNLDDAIEALRCANKNDPKNQAVLVQLGELLRLDNNGAEAITILKQATELAPEDSAAWTNLGVAFQQEKRTNDANVAYAKALSLNPHSATVLSNLGAMAKEANEWETALEYFLRALKLDPYLPETHSNLGVTLKELGRLDEAEASYKHAIALKPDYAQAHSNLGNALKELGRLDEAEASCRRSIALKPGFAEAHSNLGDTLKELGRLDDAEASYSQAIRLKPDYAHAHNNLAISLQELGRLDEAKASYTQAIVLNPDYAEAHRNLTSMKKFEVEDGQYLKMRELYLDDNIPGEQRCHINFGLAKACEDLGDYKQAFVHYNEGNFLRKKQLNYNISQDVELFRLVKFYYSEIEQNLLLANELSTSLKPVFIIGLPRSGTTLVEQIISSHSKVTGAGELTFAADFGAAISVGFSKVDRESLVKFREKYLRKLKSLSKKNLMVTDKMPQNFRYLGLLAAAFPEAKIIHVKRDPAAVCWANYRQYFASKNIGYCYEISDVLSYYKLYEDLMEFWQKKLIKRIYSLDYELLTVNQENLTRQLIDYLELDWDENCLSPHNNTRSVATASNIQIRQKIYKGSSEQWKKYEPFLNGAFNDLL